MPSTEIGCGCAKPCQELPPRRLLSNGPAAGDLVTHIEDNGSNCSSEQQIISNCSLGNESANHIPVSITNLVTSEIRIQGNHTPQKFEIYDLNAKRLLAGEALDLIDVSTLTSGLYLLKFGNESFKFIVKSSE